MSGKGVARSPGIDREGVDTAGHQRIERIINEAMPGYATKALEAAADEENAEMPALAGTGMAGMQVAVVRHFEALGLQRSRECGLDFDGADAHFSVTDSGARSSRVGSFGAGSGFR